MIFCPKYRRKVLVPPINARLKELILEKQEEYEYIVLDMEVMPDHLHLVLDVNPIVGVNKVVAQIKGWTSNRISKEFPFMTSRLPSLWTRSRFISTVGAVTLEVVQKYIEGKRESEDPQNPKIQVIG